MKKLITILLLLTLIGCSGLDESITQLIIKNNTVYTIYDVTWNGTSYGDIAGYQSVTRTVDAGMAPVYLRLSNFVKYRTIEYLTMCPNITMIFRLENDTQVMAVD